MGNSEAKSLPKTYPYFSNQLYHDSGTLSCLTPYDEAIAEAIRRSRDTELRRKVEAYLNNDLPPYYQEQPVLLLARHMATPNFESLRFLHTLSELELPVVISQDLSDRFTSKNMLKRALGKMPVCTQITQRKGLVIENYRNVTVVDFNTNQNKALREVTTTWGEPLADFHARLFSTRKNVNATIVDDAAWIDRNNRGDLLEHYKRFLALFVAHGVLFEDYLVEDKEEEDFTRNVLRPAFAFVEKEFGVRPLITQLTPTFQESVRFWLSYPKDMLPHIAQP